MATSVCFSAPQTITPGMDEEESLYAEAIKEPSGENDDELLLRWRVPVRDKLFRDPMCNGLSQQTAS